MQWNVRAYQPGDEIQILELFKRVFGYERSLAHWRWKFLENPAGQQITLAAGDDGSIIGQFAGLPVVAATHRESLLLTQGIDHMVDASMRRKGIYRAMARHFFQTFVNPTHAIAWFAFPVPANFDIEVKAFGCQGLQQVPNLVWDLSKRELWGPSLRHSWRYRVDHVKRFGAAIDGLWSDCSREYSLATVRNSRYLNWRYADRPDVDYKLMVVSDQLSDRTIGLAVMRFGWFDEPVAPMVDWMVRADDLEAARVLLSHCHDLAREKGLAATRAWFPDYAPQRDLLVSLGYRVETSRLHILSARDSEGSEVLKALREGFYYTMGDADIY